MSRRLPPPAPPRPEPPEPPAALLVGPCVEVWSARDADHEDYATVMEAWRRWGQARTTWCRSHGLSGREGYRVLPDRAPWRLGDPGAAGRIGDDVEALRREAARL